MGVQRRVEKLVNSKSFEKVTDYTIVNLDEDGKIEDWSESASKMLGYKPKEVKGSSFRIFFNEEDKDNREFRKLIDKAVKSGKTSSQTILVKKDHSTFSANILINAIYDDEHHVIGFSVIVGEVNESDHGNYPRHKNGNGHDTSRHDLEKLTAEFELIATSLSHDLKAPLRAIEGYLRIITDEYANGFNDEGKRMLGSMSKNSRKMYALIEDLVSFARVSTRRLSLSEVNTSEIVENVLQELKKSQNEEINARIGELPVIKADYSLLNLAFTHLISNAVKFSSLGEKPLIRISAEHNEESIIFKIEDNGVGFEMDYAGKLFHSFQRLHSESDFEGTGVGLAIVKLVVDKHHGKIWVEAEPNRGARFFMMLPLLK